MFQKIFIQENDSYKQNNRFLANGVHLNQFIAGKNNKFLKSTIHVRGMCADV